MYIGPFCPRCQRMNLRMGEFQCLNYLAMSRLNQDGTKLFSTEKRQKKKKNTMGNKEPFIE